jgi:hypothetical protein
MSLISPQQTSGQLDSYLARYLCHLPRASQRFDLLERLAALAEPDRMELTEYLRRLDRSTAADPRFRETYLFAPRRWPARTVLSTALNWADPALRHLPPAREDRASATLLFRETGGVSDMWLLQLPSRFHGGLHVSGSTVAAVHVSGDPMSIDVEQVTSSRTALFLGNRHRELQLRTHAEAGATVMVVASPALSETKGQETGAILRASGTTQTPVNATIPTPRSTHQREPRSDSIGHPPPQSPSSAGRSPAAAMSPDRSG